MRTSSCRDAARAPRGELGLAEAAALPPDEVLAAYVGTWYSALARAGAIDVTALLVPGAIITALLQSGSNALAPQWPAAGAALALLAARKNTGPALAGVR